MVNVQMRFAHRFDPRFDHQGGQRSTNCLRPERPSFPKLLFRLQPIQRVAKTSKTMSTKTTPAGRTAC
jgi:hypothetical protein